MQLKQRVTRWFCIDCGFKAPKRYDPPGCPTCGTSLIRIWIGPFDGERAAIDETIASFKRDPFAFKPASVNGLLWLLDRKKPLQPCR